MAQTEQEQVEQKTPLAVLFPGEAVILSNGESVFIKPWGTKALLTEVPAKLGRLLAKLAPLQDVFQGGDPVDMVPAFVQTASAELISVVAWSAGLTDEQLGELPAGDFLRLARAAVRQNRDFFVELAGLAADLKQDLTKLG